MRLFYLTLLALTAFAANSVLTRSALALDQIGPGAFGAIRLVSGAVMLAILVTARGEMKGMVAHGSWISALSLFVYAIGFSFAYVSLETGTGALILFGAVQVTMFAGALWMGERPSRARWIGAAMGLAGLAVLFGPSASKPDLSGALLMTFAAVGWGVFSLRGRGIKAPLQATATNFLIVAPAGLLIWWLFPTGPAVTLEGVVLAITSGALASGLGYALWYSVLPKLQTTTAAVAQLSVPIIALGGGMLFLGEPLTWAFALSAPLIIIGVLIGIRSK